MTTGFPDWLEPMAATLTHQRFAGPEWLFERKYDGIRLLAFRRGRTVRLLSRNKLPQHHPAIDAAVLALPVREVILDGEVAWDGGSDYHVVDILWLDGENVTRRPGLGALLVGYYDGADEVAFSEWTVHNKLRHPRLVGIREDKSPREVIRETA